MFCFYCRHVTDFNNTFIFKFYYTDKVVYLIFRKPDSTEEEGPFLPRPAPTVPQYYPYAAPAGPLQMSAPPQDYNMM